MTLSFNTGNSTSNNTGKGSINLFDPNGFEKIFNDNYAALCRYSLQFVRRSEIAEEIVQDQFIYIWNNRDHIEIHTSYQSYLYRAVRNKSIDYLRSRFAKTDFEEADEINSKPGWEDPTEKMDADELKQVISEAVKNLPEKCYTIFTMSRFGELKHQEISEMLGISVKTVENQITIALRRIKAFLEKHWMLWILFVSFFFG
jgi:RNA polymerase sigma-70 factor, ECF subfamily